MNRVVQKKRDHDILKVYMDPKDLRTNAQKAAQFRLQLRSFLYIVAKMKKEISENRTVGYERFLELEEIARRIGRYQIWTKELSQVEKDNIDTDRELYGEQVMEELI